MMLTGAFCEIFGADLTGSRVVGLAVGAVAGGVLGPVHAVFSTTPTTIIAAAGATGRSRPPAAVGRPYTGK